MNQPVRIKNKQPAALQITAEQILREAKDRQEQPAPIPIQTIADKEELAHYQLEKRKMYETQVRRNRTAVGAWLKYGEWEEKQQELDRARSVYERSLDFLPRVTTIWLKYSEMEMKHKNVNRARNVLDRVTAILPRIDVFWYKYTFMEELVENVAGARQVFERWMKWEPTEQAWMAFVKFEQRHNEYLKARNVFQRFVSAFPQPKNWLKWARFEEAETHVDFARKVYEELLSTLGSEYLDQNTYISFASFETRNKQIERARVIYKYALDALPEGQKENLYNAYTHFEKQFGGKEGIESELAANEFNYDTWFDYIRLEDMHGKPEKTRDLFERAIGHIPLVKEKRYWRRYIFLWIYYAIWEELEQDNPQRAEQVYANCVKIIPHKSFTFAKVWNLNARFLIRHGKLDFARKLFGSAIGSCPKEKLFKDYISLEIAMREFDRARLLYQKYLEWNPANCQAWIKFGDLEKMLGDTERCRAVFEIAVQQLELDMPEVLWKSYIDFECEEQEWQHARNLYKRLLERTRHVKVYISFAHFEFEALDNIEESKRIALAIKRFRETFALAKSWQEKKDRLTLLQAWLDFEMKHSTETASIVESNMPKVVKKRRRIEDDSGWEEYFDYIFPDDEEGEQANLKLLQIAHQWKQNMADMSSDEDED